MARDRGTRGRGRLIVLAVLATAATAVALVRRRKLAAHRAEFTARYG